MMRNLKSLSQMWLPLILVTYVPLLAIYLPFILHLTSLYGIDLHGSGMSQIYANWDGPNYVLNAITGYDPVEIGKRAFLARPNEYYAAHFPLYSWLMIPLAPLIGYFPAALIINLASNLILNSTLYLWIKRFSPHHALWLTLVATLMAPRHFIVRAVISPEMLMITLILIALLAWERQRYLVCALASVLAVTLKFQALILVPVLGLTLLIQTLPEITRATCAWRARYHRRLYAGQLIAILAPVLGYLIVSLYYGSTLGDPHAYLRAQDLVGMGATVPYGVFNYTRLWVQTGWLEHTLIYYIAIACLIGRLWLMTTAGQIHPVYVSFTVGYGAMLTLIPQVDIMRLAMPLMPLMIVGFGDFFTSRVWRVGLALTLPALYLYVINFIMTNQAPISDWGLFK